MGAKDPNIEELRRIAPDLAPSISRLTVPAYILDRNGVVRWLNAAAVAEFGDLRGKRIGQIVERDYVTLARAARKAIKQADPGARVVMGGFADRSWESIAAVYRAGAKGVFDVVAIHPYTFEVRNVMRIVEYARRALRKAGDGERPLWLTEVTWSSGKRPGHPPAPFETTQSDQAARLAQALPLLIRERRKLAVERIVRENWLSRDSNRANPFDFSGLRVLHPDGTVTEKPAFAEFKRIALAQR